MREVRASYTPQPRQQLLHSTLARQILYGGQAGGGKSTALRWDAYAFCLSNPGLQAYLFRKTLVDLRKNHMRFVPSEIPQEAAVFVEGRNTLECRNGSVLYFCYCEKDADVYAYQGAEMHWVGMDEAALFTPFQIGYLKTRNRLGNWKSEREDARIRLPRFAMASNPGGPAHSYLKSIFLDIAPPETIFYDETMRDPTDPSDKGWPSVFIPAKMSDNVYLDKDYAASFGGLPPEMARALREGDWDAVVGQALHSLSRERHMLRQFEPPKHWTRFQSLDWGTAHPFSVGWYAVSDGAILKGRESWPDRWLPAGAVIRYDEWYGWNGRPNHGARLAPQAVGRGIIERELARKDRMDFRIADNEIWAQKGGPSVSEWLHQADPRLTFQKSQKDRKRNYAEVLARLAGNPRILENGKVEEDPMFFITANCRHFWRTCPILTLDEVSAEKGPSDKQSEENHVYDEVAYALRSRSYVITEEGRYDMEHYDEIKAARSKMDDPYATA